MLRGLAWAIAAFISAALVGGCTSWPLARSTSSLDARYRLNRIESQSDAGNTSPGVRAYQRWLSRTLAGHCRYLPSDSRYERLLARRCGPWKASVKAMARFMEEYEAPALGRPIVSMGNEIYYEDLPRDCRWF